jgi:uncharacterized membrane protein YhaH (DUF805 family)
VPPVMRITFPSSFMSAAVLRAARPSNSGASGYPLGVLPPIRPLARLPYVALGVILFAFKTGLDYVVSERYGRVFSPLFYVSPMDAPLFRRADAPGYWLTLWAVAIPFIAVGCFLTLRRLRDAGLSPWYVALFFVPFANLLFFAVCTAAPSKESAKTEIVLADWSAYRAGVTYVTRVAGERRSMGASVMIAGACGAVIALGAVGISVGVMRSYGAALMLGAPVVAGFATSMVFVRLRPDKGIGGAVLATLVSFFITFGVTISFAIEGIGCLVMVVPLVLPATLIGALFGYMMAKGVEQVSPAAPIVVLPFLLGAESMSPQREVQSEAVVSEVVVNAPPDVVWKRVIAFPPLAPADDFMFRHGIAAPMRATIDGEGPGAVRRCEFTTGTFVEPIEIWSPGRELTFSVAAQPDPMVEQTLWHSVRPPHLDGYLRSTRGQFLLEPLDGGRTRLTGRTWYRTGMTPEPYWRLWGDAIIHRIHLRVLEHVATLAEADAAAAAHAGH